MVAIARMASISAGAPAMCTGTITFVFGVIHCSRCTGSIFRLRSSLVITGVAPNSKIASTVATNVNACVITSSPCLTPIARMATSSAAVPEDTTCACCVPTTFAISRSNSRTLKMPLRRLSNPCAKSTPLLASNQSRIAWRSSVPISSYPGIFVSCYSHRGRQYMRHGLPFKRHWVKIQISLTLGKCNIG